MGLEKLEMRPVKRFGGRVRPPGSKSITNRALVCAALAQGESLLCGALNSEDTQVMVEGLRQLGIAIQQESPEALRTVGCGGHLASKAADLFVANSGTTMRFLAAVAAIGRGQFRLDGIERMRQRPIGDLLDALRQLGVQAESERGDGCPPVVIHANRLPGGKTSIAGNISSQFLSGLLLAAPYASQPVEIEVVGPLVSQPYVEMTLDVMRAFGVNVQSQELKRFVVPNQSPYRAYRYTIEPDASAASYFFAAAAITGGTVTVEGLGQDSLQGDVKFCDCLAAMGCEVRYARDSITVTGPQARGRRLLGNVEHYMNAISDTVQTMGVVALFAQGPVTIAGVPHIRHKETDRLAALASELRKLGAKVQEFDAGLRIEPGPLRPAEIETYNDHRMAMSLALAGLVQSGVVILDPGCTRKTYPGYFADLERLCTPA